MGDVNFYLARDHDSYNIWLHGGGAWTSVRNYDEDGAAVWCTSDENGVRHFDVVDLAKYGEI